MTPPEIVSETRRERLAQYLADNNRPGDRFVQDDLGLLGTRLGGEGGIRTHDTLARIPVFETGTFNRSVTSPVGLILPAPRISAPDRSPSRDPCKAAAREEYLRRRRRVDSFPLLR